MSIPPTAHTSAAVSAVTPKKASASNVWAIGGNVVEHYNGSNWTRCVSRSLPGTRHLWAVGWNTDTTGNETPLAS